MIEVAQSFRMVGTWRIDVYLPSGRLVSTQSFRNLVTNVGGALALDKLIGAAGTSFANSNARICVGDSLTAPAVTDTDLIGGNKFRKAVDATFPSRVGQVVTFQATFAVGDANFTWNEIGLANAAAAGDLFSRSLIPNPFTKSASLVIVPTYTLTCPV